LRTFDPREPQGSKISMSAQSHFKPKMKGIPQQEDLENEYAILA
jgi:hypothetical protein